MDKVLHQDLPQILSIDTSTEACSVALSSQANSEVRSEYLVAPRKHAELILNQVNTVLAQVKLEQLDAIAVTVGPGAFTGVRLGIAVAQGLAFAANLNIIGIGTLETLAMAAVNQQASQNVLEEVNIAVAIDARMGEVYWGCFQWRNGTLNSIQPNRVCAVTDIDFNALKIESDWLFAGTGWDAQAEQFKQKLGFVPNIKQELLLPDAKIALMLAQQRYQNNPMLAVSAELIEPVYLRDKVAETTIERLSKKKTD
jgi:tRNA threonylcarbamoyladenosine biosynthesis protein TsaB